MPTCTRCGEWAGDESWRKLCRPCFVASKRIEQRELEDELDFYKDRCARLEKQLVIPADTVKRLLQLCHPDKHGNSKIANEVTQWLLSIRKK